MFIESNYIIKIMETEGTWKEMKIPDIPITQKKTAVVDEHVNICAFFVLSFKSVVCFNHLIKLWNVSLSKFYQACPLAEHSVTTDSAQRPQW